MNNKKRVQEFLDDLKNHFHKGLQVLNLTGYYMRIVEEPLDKDSNDKIAVTLYEDGRTIQIKWGKVFYENWKKYGMDFHNVKSIYHELSHVIIWRLAELAHKRYASYSEIVHEDEMVSEHLSLIFMKLLDKDAGLNTTYIDIEK